MQRRQNINTNIHTGTLPLLDQLGPEGRVGEKFVVLKCLFWGVVSWLKKPTWTPYSIIQPNLGGGTVMSLETNLVFRNSWTDTFDVSGPSMCR